jgi:hypothetical protein
MKPTAMTCFLRSAGLIALSLTAAIAMKPEASYAQSVSKGTDPNDLRTLAQESGLLSYQGGQKLMAEADQAFSAGNYTLAVKKLQEARQVFNQLSNFYQDIAGSFSGIDNRVSDTQRRKALDAAQLRDEATYRLALAHRAQSQPELAVPLLVQIIRSQQPTRELGQKSYQQLLEMGFVDVPYPRTRAEQPQPTGGTVR